jgi:L-amino acid N-acyltransferase YncA
MEIRPAELNDAAAIAVLENAEITGGVAHFGLEPVTAVDIARQIGHLRHPFLVAVENDVLGFARCGPWKSRGAYAWSAEIGVYVASSAQGRGVATALYAAAIPALEAMGCRTIIAGIVLPNPASVALHERFGFTAVGVFERNGFKHGAWHDVGYWSLHVGEGPIGVRSTGATGAPS